MRLVCVNLVGGHRYDTVMYVLKLGLLSLFTSSIVLTREHQRLLQ